MSKQNIRQLKSNIYAQIEQLTDETTLLMLQEAVTVYSSYSNKDILDELTALQQQRLQESIKQANEKKTFSNDEVKQKAKEWLSKSSGL
jgi:hypothetical protein